ncbi:MAG: cell division topological specificity factor [Pseudomonadota bacterium]|jgi:cell division topological specificity factor
MSLLNYIFGNRPKNTASLAKERLQIIVSHERRTENNSDFLPKLQQELIEVIAKYVDIDQEQVKVELERTGNCSVLELNITLPNAEISIGNSA